MSGAWDPLSVCEFPDAVFWRVGGGPATPSIVLSSEATGSSNSSCLCFHGEKNLDSGAVCQSTELCCADLLQNTVGRGAPLRGLSGFYDLDSLFSFHFRAVERPGSTIASRTKRLVVRDSSPRCDFRPWFGREP